jgi:hypothetical protein
MSSLQWAMGMILPTSLAGTTLAPPEFRVWFFYVFVGTVIYFLVIYTYWTFFDPDRLHTEEHREHMTQLNSYRDSTGLVLEEVANTAPPQMVSGPTTIPSDSETRQ